MNFLFVRDFIYYAIGYSFFFICGLRLKNMLYSDMKKVILFSIALFVFYIVYFYWKFDYTTIIPFQNYKYPPNSYYIIYGIFMSVLLYYIKYVLPGRAEIFFSSKQIMFIGSNTIWIYLYHIPLIQITTFLNVKIWYLQFLIVYLLAIMITYIQVSIVKMIENKYKKTSILSYFKG